MMKDMNRLQATQKTSPDRKAVREGVDIWKDSDFFFSVVFQSSAQKYTFLEEFSRKFGLGIDTVKSGDEVVQILNGLELASKIGVRLTPEKPGSTPYANLELAALVMDDQKY